jgi:uncharacterized membrane protein
MKRLRVLGHPVHPPAVHAPLGLWAAAAAWDAAALATGRPELWTLSFGCPALGCLAALPALATGFLDFLVLEREEAESTARWHMVLMAACWLLYAASAAVRGGWTAPEHAAWAAGLQFAGLAVLSVGGWLGGRLVYTYGAGVEEGYNGKGGTAPR